MASQAEKFLMPILEEEGPDIMLFQQHGAPPHFQKGVTDSLNRRLPEKWIDRGGPLGHLVRLTLLPLIFWGDAVYVPPLTTTMPEPAGRIRDTVATGTLNLLNVKTEIQYRYICQATHGALIEHL
jgi:hypothetical protein